MQNISADYTINTKTLTTTILLTTIAHK
jgi:hypothetical protein